MEGWRSRLRDGSDASSSSSLPSALSFPLPFPHSSTPPSLPLSSPPSPALTLSAPLRPPLLSLAALAELASLDVDSLSSQEVDDLAAALLPPLGPSPPLSSLHPPLLPLCPPPPSPLLPPSSAPSATSLLLRLLSVPPPLSPAVYFDRLSASPAVHRLVAHLQTSTQRGGDQWDVEEGWLCLQSLQREVAAAKGSASQTSPSPSSLPSVLDGLHRLLSEALAPSQSSVGGPPFPSAFSPSAASKWPRPPWSPVPSFPSPSSFPPLPRGPLSPSQEGRPPLPLLAASPPRRFPPPACQSDPLPSSHSRRLSLPSFPSSWAALPPPSPTSPLPPLLLWRPQSTFHRSPAEAASSDPPPSSHHSPSASNADLSLHFPPRPPPPPPAATVDSAAVDGVRRRRASVPGAVRASAPSPGTGSLMTAWRVSQSASPSFSFSSSSSSLSSSSATSPSPLSQIPIFSSAHSPPSQASRGRKRRSTEALEEGDRGQPASLPSLRTLQPHFALPRYNS